MSNEIQVLPALQSQKELDSLLRNMTRDTTRIREFIAKEKNDLYRTELTKIFSATMTFADKYDGCDKKVMDTLDFKKDARSVFQQVANQRRGGRKILFVMISSPTSGLDQHFVSWWPTVRGLDTASIRLMESFLKRLTIEITAEADVGDLSVSPPTLSENDTEVMWKKKLQSDVVKTVKEKLASSDGFEGYSLATVGNGDEFTITVTMIKRHDDSGVGDNVMSGNRDMKQEMPAPVFAFNPPKSEASRNDSSARPLDQDGFWIDSDSDNEFVQVANMTPKGCILLHNYFILKILSFKMKS